MQSLITHELPYSKNSSSLYERLRGYDMPVFIDSAAPYSKQGRYDILSAEPFHVLSRENATPKKYLYQQNSDNFFEEVKTSLQSHFPHTEKSEYPFSGGAIGYFGYNLGQEVESINAPPGKTSPFPDALVGLYSWGIIVDHKRKKTNLVAQPFSDQHFINELRRNLHVATPSEFSDFRLGSPFRSNYSKAQYSDAFNQVKRYINAGDCYQVNLSQCFSAIYEGDPWQGYLLLRRTAAAPFSAYMEWNDNALLCVSPERFIECRPPMVVTSPIKGTIKRGRTKLEDNNHKKHLITSAKDKAENLMIVDLMRNDMGRSCETGSISVDKLFELQTFETVHHLVSTITGKLKADIQSIDLISSCFPGGSITGAPKIRAMNIINELESHHRSVYCGSMGYISCDGQMDSNIAIRTMACHKNTISCWSGGGIVADSSCDGEYWECLDKVEKLILSLKGVIETTP